MTTQERTKVFATGAGLGTSVLVGGLAAGVLCNGPFFGIMFTAVPLLIVAVVAHDLGKRALRAGRLDRVRTRALVTAVVAVVSFVGVYLLLRPPAGAEIIKEYLGLAPHEFSDVRTWTDTWGIDPAYAVKFRADPGVLDRLAPATASAATSLSMDESARPPIWNPALSMPGWWKPESLDNARSWLPKSGNPVIQLRFDPQTGEAYLLVMYH